MIALLLGAVACGSDTDEEPRVVDEPDMAVTPDKGVADAYDMGADDVFELPGPDLYEMTEEDAIGAWEEANFGSDCRRRTLLFNQQSSSGTG